MSDPIYHAGDEPLFERTVTELDGTVINLTGATIKLNTTFDGADFQSRTAAIQDAATGILEYQWVSGATALVAGLLRGQFVVTDVAGKPIGLPEFELEILARVS